MRFQLKQIAIAGLLVGLGAAAMAANDRYGQLKALNPPKSPPMIVLKSGALPDAVVGQPYNAGAGFDLKSVLQVSGDSSFNPSLTSFAITSGTLPTGLTVSATGVISGTPTVANPGSVIQVTVNYKTASGMQTYQITSLNSTVARATATAGACVVTTAGGDKCWRLTSTGQLRLSSATESRVPFPSER